jgi:hypothetical protein
MSMALAFRTSFSPCMSGKCCCRKPAGMASPRFTVQPFAATALGKPISAEKPLTLFLQIVVETCVEQA